MFGRFSLGIWGLCSFRKIRQGLAGLLDGVIHDAHEPWDFCLKTGNPGMQQGHRCITARAPLGAKKISSFITVNLGELPGG